MNSLYLSEQSDQLLTKADELDPATLRMYQSFMAGYVRRINEATFNVAIGGVRIGLAKYSRLAQINLKTRIMTFSKFAIENVPERGRRYLVIHELAHVKEASHNKRFWELVGRYEPNYRQIGRNLELAFKKNVNQEDKKVRKVERKEETSVSKSVIKTLEQGAKQLKFFGSLFGESKQFTEAPLTESSLLLDPQVEDSENLNWVEGDFSWEEMEE